MRIASGGCPGMARKLKEAVKMNFNFMKTFQSYMLVLFLVTVQCKPTQVSKSTVILGEHTLETVGNERESYHHS